MSDDDPRLESKLVPSFDLARAGQHAALPMKRLAVDAGMHASRPGSTVSQSHHHPIGKRAGVYGSADRDTAKANHRFSMQKAGGFVGAKRQP